VNVTAGVRGVHHTAVVVPDLDEAITFYTELLDAEIIERDRWRAPNPEVDSAIGLSDSSADGVMLRGSGSYIELWQYLAPQRHGASPLERGAHELGWRHLALEVAEINVAIQQVCELGGSTMGEPLRYPNGGAAVYCRDPFGNIIELMVSGDDLASLDDL